MASKISSKSSRAMIEAMIDGERDPKVLAQMAKSRLRAKIPQLEEAFSGRFGSHHALVCRQVIEHMATVLLERTTGLGPATLTMAEKRCRLRLPATSRNQPARLPISF